MPAASGYSQSQSAAKTLAPPAPPLGSVRIRILNPSAPVFLPRTAGNENQGRPRSGSYRRRNSSRSASHHFQSRPKVNRRPDPRAGAIAMGGCLSTGRTSRIIGDDFDGDWSEPAIHTQRDTGKRHHSESASTRPSSWASSSSFGNDDVPDGTRDDISDEGYELVTSDLGPAQYIQHGV